MRPSAQLSSSTGKPELILRSACKVWLSVNSLSASGKRAKLPIIPFFEHGVQFSRTRKRENHELGTKGRTRDGMAENRITRLRRPNQ